MQPSDEQKSHEFEELASILDALEDGGCYRVERTLKDTGYETTQVVYRTNGRESGPFIRKTFTADSGCGQAYANIYQAQVAGCRFAHQPIIYECTQVDDCLTVVMEYVQGETLSQLVHREGPSEELAVRVGIMLCDALAELHEKATPSIIHRDVKPSNIMMTDDHLVLVDLGIARETRPDARRDTTRFGTLGYAPPEQFGYGQTSVRSDVYAAGMVVAFCLTGCDDNEALRDRNFESIEASPELRGILVKATEFDPKMRYASARDMGACLQHVAATVDREALELQACVGTPGHMTPVHDVDEVSKLHAVDGVVSATNREEHGADIAVVVGRVWNAAITLVWVAMLCLVISVAISPTEALAAYSHWFVVVGYLLVIVVPCTLLCYLAMNKRDIRRHVGFLSHLSWKAEVPVCIVGSIASMVLAVIVGMATGQIT
ncbi:MAG: serine/threonine protein kinase [Eggerthellaceae bacterium]|nr:serine/threonine protein kinase [Eggerthellaceae bacterium]